ncbi:MAG: hydrogenase expression/formation protein HypE, partial [Bacteroidota bacterium]
MGHGSNIMGESDMEKVVRLSHGSGGKQMQRLIHEVFHKHLGNRILNSMTDSAILKIPADQIAFTTDGFVVDPIFFPGGDIGNLAVCGTVNDLAVSGAKPLYLSSSFIIEEGFSVDDLERIVVSMAMEAKRAGVTIVTGDTKVVNKGKCDKIFITTSGIGLLEKKNLHISKGQKVKKGDVIIINGTIGDHGMTVMNARESFHFNSSLQSDCFPLNRMIGDIL